MTHADINDLPTRDYIFKIGDREKGIQARYDENTDAIIFPRAVFDYVYKLLKEALSQEPCTDAVSRQAMLDETIRKNSIWNSITNSEGKNLEEIIFELPPVTQKPNFCASCKHNTDNEICLECEYDGITRGMTRYESVTQKSGKWDRLYSWLNDMRLGIAPDETVTDIDERHCRESQTDILDEIMEWMIKAESEE